MNRTAEESGGIAGRAAAASALILMGALAAGQAQALTLGGMTVQSNLGEPLRAQIQVSDLTPSEAASLTVQSASPAAFQAAGIEYSAALAGMQVTVERRGGNQAVVRIAGNRPANEPFVEVLLEASWAGGRLSRNYTLLLDPPPAAQRTQPPAPLAPQIAPPPLPAPAISAPAPAPAPAPVFAPRPAPAPAIARPVPQARPRVAAPAPAAGQTTVRPGDTAGGIAARTKSPNVSLDQMLVAMLQSNPDAFVNGNVNRLRSGAVLNVPSEADAAATPAPEARQIVIAQSRDFNEFRRRLAAGAPSVASAAPQRQASGSVQTQVEDRRPNAAAPDRLTLSKGAANTQAAAEAERVARAKQEADSKQRLAELSRNVDELNRLGTPAGSSATPAATPPAAPPAPAPEAPAAAAPPVPAPAAAPAPAPAAAAPAAPKPAAPIKAPVPVPETATSFLDDTPLGDPKVLGVVGLLVALIVALVSYRAVRRRRGISTDAGFVDKKNPDSFFADTGGEHVNTQDGGPSTLATSYSPSQLDAGGEVDPVAEADVYLAYGRDLQAEDILKEALRSHPERTALHAKLAEIYAKRKDVAAFNTLAGEAHRLTGGVGADWERIQALGEELDPTHALFRGAAVGAGVGAAASISAAAVAALAAEPPAPVEPALEPEPEPVVEETPDIGLDFDFDEPAPAPAPQAPAELPPSLDLDFGAFTPDAAAPPAPVPSSAPSSNDEPDFGLDFNLDDDLDFDKPAPATDAEPMPSLDLSSFSLDLDEDEDAEPAARPPAPPPAPAPTAPPAFEAPSPEEALDDTDLPDVAPDDALATKLALAEEFNAIGDVDGARHLIEEVISEASGSVRDRAERMLSSLQ